MVRTSTLIATGGALMSASVASAQDTRPILWNDLRLGMTTAEVKALYPKNPMALTTECNAVVKPNYEAGKLASVELEWSVRDKGTKCPDVIFTTLVSKYGQPIDSDSSIRINQCGNPYLSGVSGFLANLCRATGGNQPTVTIFKTWRSGEVDILYKRDTDSSFNWNVYYTPIVKPSPEAAAKL